MGQRRQSPARTSRAEDVHEWISFSDPTEDRTWIFDATYLRSNHRCIYGEGCQGVLDADATDMQQGCCSYGAHFVDDDDVQTVVRAFVKVRPEHMQFHAEAVADGFLDAGEPEADGTPVTVTRLVDEACIFLTRPGFAGGAGTKTVDDEDEDFDDDSTTASEDSSSDYQSHQAAEEEHHEIDDAAICEAVVKLKRDLRAMKLADGTRRHSKKDVQMKILKYEDDLYSGIKSL